MGFNLKFRPKSERFEADQAIKGLTRAVEALWTSDEVRSLRMIGILTYTRLRKENRPCNDKSRGGRFR